MSRNYKLWDSVDMESDEEILNLRRVQESSLQIISQVLWRHRRALEPRKGGGGWGEQLQRCEKKVKIGQEEAGDTISSLMCSQGIGGLSKPGGLGSILQGPASLYHRVPQWTPSFFVYFCLSIKGEKELQQKEEQTQRRTS